jgi:hypothetical protein
MEAAMSNNADILRNILGKTSQEDMKGNMNKLTGFLNTEQGETLKNAVKSTSIDVDEIERLIQSGDIDRIKEKALEISRNIDPQVLKNLAKLLG